MKKTLSKCAQIVISILMAAILLSGCATGRGISSSESASEDVRVFMYGESHGEQVIVEHEVAEWQRFYNEDGMRHLFIENSYAAVAYLNQWMHEDNDDILLQLYDDLTGTLAHSESTLYFYRTIKETCPETIFHGTDIGHQFASNGARYLAELEATGMKDSEEYRLAEENNRQGMEFYEAEDDTLREKYMVQNFIREFDSLPPDTKVMGIYGSLHVCYEIDMTGTGPSMITQLKSRYGNIFSSKNISGMKPDLDPIATGEMTVNGRIYTSNCFQEQDLSMFEGYESRAFWRLENAFGDFTTYQIVTENYLPQTEFPVPLHLEDVWMLVYKMTDGSLFAEYLINLGDSDDTGYITYEVILTD